MILQHQIISLLLLLHVFNYIKNDDIYHAETTTDDNMLETAYNMLLFVLKNILGREIK